MDITVDVSDLARMAQRYAGAQAIVTEELTKGVARGQILVQNEARRLVPVNTGRLRSSIASDRPARIGDAIVGKVGTNVHYGPYVEHGTRPHFAPFGAIEAWAARKGADAHSVWIAIARKGTKAHPYLKPALETNRGRIAVEIERAVWAAMGRIGGGR